MPIDPQAGLSSEQAKQVQQAFGCLMDAVRQHVGDGGHLTNDLKLTVKKRRVVGFKLRCEVKPPESESLEWLNKLTACIASLTGYGEVKAITNGIGQVVGGRIEVSYVFS